MGSLLNQFISIKYTVWYLFLVCFLFPSLNLTADEQNATDLTIEIVVNSSVVDQSYTLADVRAIFAMRKTHWSNGEKIAVFVLPDDNPLHRQFTKFKLNMFPHQFRRIWDRLIFSGIGQGPKEVESFSAMQKILSTTPGAIGYLKSPIKNKKVRVLNYE
jgi:ABC-type phosphate transport system substrate-binding protein